MANLAFFYENIDLNQGDTISLSEETARHIGQVLRMKSEDKIMLANGRGSTATAVLTIVEKKKCSVIIESVVSVGMPKNQLHLAVAFTKNASRNEWLLEKATESGAMSITPILAERTEREKFRFDRWQNILVSAMLQSQQYFLPKLIEPSLVEKIVESHKNTAQKLIAHCDENFHRTIINKAFQPHKETIFLIGPEGDFSPGEIKLFYENGFEGIALCNQRLRTETAAMSVCAYFNLINNE